MGLDNGILLKTYHKRQFSDISTLFKREPWEDAGNYDYTVLYWTKCPNVREAIWDYLKVDRKKRADIGMHISIDQFEDICNILHKLYTKRNWEKGESCWSWDQIGQKYKDDLKFARKVLKWLKTKPVGSYQLYFHEG
jgi:hypothetical protein